MGSVCYQFQFVLSEIIQFFKSPKVREFLWWCLPALAVGFALRTALMISMPQAYIQYDTADFLVTPYRLLTKHAFYIHSKRSFLTPLLFSIPFLLHLPALIFIAVMQHVMGLAAVVTVGALVRLWFARWRWFILPVTLLFAACPWPIWYEHALLGEAQFLDTLLLCALAATVFARWPGRWSFAFYAASVVAVLGTRLEGKFFFGVGLILVVFAFWRQWQRMAIYLAIGLLLPLLAARFGGKRDPADLLYASLILLTPDHLQSAPGYESALLPLRDRVRAEYGKYPGDTVKIAKLAGGAIEGHLMAQGMSKEQAQPKSDEIFKSICLEILREHPWQVMILPFQKFRLAVDGWTSYDFNAHYLGARQLQAVARMDWMSKTLGRGLTGEAVQNHAQMKEFILTHYQARRVEWFREYQGAWNRGLVHFRTADHPAEKPRWVHDFFGGVHGGRKTIPGVPFFYFFALAGMLAAVLRWRRLGPFHLAWCSVMLFTWYAATLVAVTNARFRFAYEPFCYIYAFLLFDVLLDVFLTFKARRQLRSLA
jgi:hypothetical protein